MNENYLKIKEQTLVDIASAIRSKLGNSELITVSNLDDKIRLLSLPDGPLTGLYAWKKYKVSEGEKGELLDYAVAESETAYPEDGLHTDGYWYESIDIAIQHAIEEYSSEILNTAY